MLLVQEPTVQHRLATIAMYVRAHLDERLTLGEISELAGFSAFHFHRIFRTAFGENFNAYVVRHRMMRAAYELRYGNAAVIDVALRCGYESHSAFSRAFVRAFSMTPSAYRVVEETPTLVPPRSVPPSEMMPGPRIEEYPARDALAIRFVGPYDHVGPALQRVHDVALRRGFFPSASILGLSYECPDLEEHDSLRFDACVTTTPLADVAGARADGLQTIDVRAGRYAVFRHRGPYERITHMYDLVVASWILTGRLALREAPFITTYLSDPAVTSDADLECDLAVPIH